MHSMDKIKNHLEQIKLKQFTYKGFAHIRLDFPYNQQLIDLIKTIKEARWSQSYRCWHLADNRSNRDAVLNTFKGLTELEISEFKENKEQISNRLSQNNILKVRVNEVENRNYLEFDYNKSWIDRIKSLHGAWYHAGAKMWSVYGGEYNLEDLKNAFADEKCTIIIENSDFSIRPSKKKVEKVNKENLVPSEFGRQLRLLNLSKNTIIQYESLLNFFLHFLQSSGHDFNSDEIPLELIKTYLHNKVEKEGFSNSYHRQIITSLRQYYLFIHRIELDKFDLPQPRKEKNLPKVISKEAVARMFKQIHNLKHQIIIGLLYGCGLRCNELIELEVNNIDFDRRMVRIKGKGKKIRVVPIPIKLIPLLHAYLKSYLPKKYLLSGQNSEKYSAKSVQEVIKKAAKAAKIKQTVTPHVMRHCFATHLLEDGVDLRVIQELLGHSSSKTTEIYTFVSRKSIMNIKSPFDDIL